MLEHGEPGFIRAILTCLPPDAQLPVERLQHLDLFCPLHLRETTARRLPCPRIELTQPRSESIAVSGFVPISELDLDEVGDARVGRPGRIGGGYETPRR